MTKITQFVTKFCGTNVLYIHDCHPVGIPERFHNWPGKCATLVIGMGDSLDFRSGNLVAIAEKKRCTSSSPLCCPGSTGLPYEGISVCITRITRLLATVTLVNSTHISHPSHVTSQPMFFVCGKTTAISVLVCRGLADSSDSSVDPLQVEYALARKFKVFCAVVRASISRYHNLRFIEAQIHYTFHRL